ncbi:MAG: PH domain-containing protein [Vicinamibacteraceae bacterium]
MPSELPPASPGRSSVDADWRRLHPLTLVFAIGARLYGLRGLVLPAVVALVVSRRRAPTGGWQDFEGWLLAPAGLLLIFELVQYFTLAYRFDRHEIVIARGLIWKRERHIPYARIQNIELIQHAPHRLAGVAVVRLDTGTGGGAEGELSVLSLEAVTELRDAVRLGERGDIVAATGPAVTAPGILVALDPRELLLHGLLTGSGWVVIAAAFGAAWQLDLSSLGFSLDRYLPSAEGVWGGLRHATPFVALEIALVVGFALLTLRVLSAAWSAIKHFAFTLTARGGELFQSYGLVTRVARTIPRARIQKLTVSQEPLMWLAGRATVTIDTAASVSERRKQQASEGSHVLVPIVPASRVASLVRDVYPIGAGVAPDLDALDWHGVDPRAFRRLLRVRLVLATLIGAASYGAAHRWAIAIGLAAAAALTLQAWVAARFTAFAWSGDTLCFRSATTARHVTLVRASRAQVVSLERSPFDRRWGMAAVRVDTAGAATGGHHVHIRWLPDAVADTLYARLRHAAAR